jgi:hypothetical protein
LLKHNHFEIERARVLEDGDKQRVKERESLEETDGSIVAVEATMPIGVLTVKSKPRTNNHQSSIVNAETIDSSVFED